MHQSILVAFATATIFAALLSCSRAEAKTPRQKKCVTATAAPTTKSSAYSSSSPCLKVNDTTGNFCRFHDDCCAGLLCYTNSFYFTGAPPRCIENVPENHQSDPFATKKVLLSSDYVRNTYPGMERWRDKVAVVTGAASGLGFALVKRLCSEGMIVVGADMNELGLKKTADHCLPGKFYSFTLDLRIEADIINLFRYINETVGRVDVLFNNAGVSRKTTLYNPSSEALQTLFDVNLIAPILCAREALKIMFAKNIENGHILFTNAVIGGYIQEVPYGNVEFSIMPYTVTKHALRVVAEGLRRELRAKGSKIRVGQVAPAVMRTNIPNSFVPRDFTDQNVIAHIFENPGFRALAHASPDEVVEAFLYILTAPEHLDVHIVEFKDFSLH